MPADTNVPAKEFEKKYKYKDLELEIQRSWKMKTKVIPALGVISQDFLLYLEEIPGELCSKELQKITIMGTAHIIRKTLSMR